MRLADINQYLFILFFAGALTYFISMFLFVPQSATEVGIGGAYSRRREFNHWFLRIFGSLIMSMGEVMSVLPLGNSREKLRKKLTQAGMPGGLSVDEFNAARVVAIGLLAAAGAALDFLLYTFPVMATLLGCLGVIYPDIWLSGLTQRRRRSIFRDLPDTLDILRLAVDAGLDLSSAMKIVVEKGRKGPLLDELEKVEREMSLGRTRKEAMRNFADRLAMSEINSFVLALIQADQLGASIGPILKVQSEMARTRRWQLAEVLVNKMPMKMLGPLVVFIFPASFIILFTPLIIQWMQSGD